MGLSTTSSGSFDGASVTFSKPGSLTITVPFGLASVNVPSASVRISLPSATIDAPARGCFWASTTRPVTCSGQAGVGAGAATGGVGASAGVAAIALATGGACRASARGARETSAT